MIHHFVGIDLAWNSDKKHTGLAILTGDEKGAILTSLKGFIGLAEIVEFISSNTDENAVVAIDAPLIIENHDKSRKVDRKIGVLFGKYHASAHSVNKDRYPDAGSLRLVELLLGHGFEHSPNPPTDKLRKGRWIFEVYPHPAHVVLFNLQQIIKYKKGRVDAKRVGLKIYRNHLSRLFANNVPSVSSSNTLDDFISENLQLMKGKSLKRYEDKLDALFCAYLAYYYWYWGDEKCEIIGDSESGYIINPTW